MTLVEKLDLVILSLTIIAIVAGPIIAVWMTRRADERRQAYFRRLEVYRNLMLTRSVRIAPDHVRALNLVPVEFAQRLFRKGLSGGALDDSSRLSRPSWRHHVDPDHPRAA